MASFTPYSYAETTWWIDRGIIASLPKSAQQQPFAEFDLPFRVFCLVRVQISKHVTSIRWDVDHADNPSLDAAFGFIAGSTKPVRLEFFKDGWAFETYRDANEAAQRFGELRELRHAKLNRLAVTETRDADDVNAMSALLRRATQSTGADVEYQQLFYDYDEHLDDFILTMAGEGSGLAQTMGPEWVKEALGTGQCPNQHDDYDRTVIPAYFDVMESGRNHYDYVVAAVAPPGQEQLWAPYQRLIQPLLRDGVRTGVRVTCQIMPDRIPLLSGL